MDSLLKWLVCHKSRRRRCHNDVLKYGVQLQLPATNNEAEYEAILASLRVARAFFHYKKSYMLHFQNTEIPRKKPHIHLKKVNQKEVFHKTPQVNFI